MKNLENPQSTTSTPGGGRVRFKVRGTATFIREGDELRDFEFTGFQAGEPVKNVLRKHGQSQLYETKNSLVAQLKVSRDVADPEAEMADAMADLLKGRMPKLPKLPRTKRLIDRDGLRVWHDRKAGKVTVLMELPAGQIYEMQGRLFNLTQEVYKCLAISKISSTQQGK